MKKIFVLLFSVLLLAFVGCSKQTTSVNDPPGAKVEYAVDQPAPSADGQATTSDVFVVQDVAEQPPGEADKTFWQLIADNWGSLLLALLGFVELLVRLTPTEKDNSILNMIIKFLNVILPNLKKGGGTFITKTG